MAYDQFHQINATSQMIEVALRSATTGQLLTGVAFGSVTAKYVREGSNTQVTVSVVTATQGTFTSGGWVETGIAGVYQFGIPDAALAAGAKAVTLVFSASGAIDVVKRVLLVVEDLREVLVSSRLAPATAGRTLAVAATGEAAANVTMWNSGALPDVAEVSDLPAAPLDATATQAAAAAALAAYDPPTKAELDSAVAPLSAALADVPTNAEFEARTLPAADYTVVSDLPTAAPTAAAIADAVWDEALAGHAAAGSTGAALSSAGAAGDPWATELPGAYTGTDAGAILGRLAALDTTAVTQVAASNAGHLTITTALTFNEPVTGLTIPATWVTALWTLKADASKPDTAALVQLRETNPAALTDGLVRLNGAAVASPLTAASGALTVTQASGRIDIYLTDEATALLDDATGLGWDVKFINAAGDSTGYSGTADVVLTETKATA